MREIYCIASVLFLKNLNKKRWEQKQKIINDNGEWKKLCYMLLYP